METNGNILIHEDPKAVNEAIRNAGGCYLKTLRISKGADTLYVVVRSRLGATEVYDVAAYGGEKVSDILESVASKPVESLSFVEGNKVQKIANFLGELISVTGTAKIKINGEDIEDARFGTYKVSFRDIKEKFM